MSKGMCLNIYRVGWKDVERYIKYNVNNTCKIQHLTYRCINIEHESKHFHGNVKLCSKGCLCLLQKGYAVKGSLVPGEAKGRNSSDPKGLQVFHMVPGHPSPCTRLQPSIDLWPSVT